MKRLAAWLVIAGYLAMSCSSEPDYVDCVHTTTDSTSRRDSDTLPSGACRPSEPVCSLVVRDPCPCKVQVPRKFYQCRCKGGSWVCELTSEDAGLCPVGTSLCDGDWFPDAGDAG